MAEALIRQFMNIFIGYEQAHGQHELFAQADEGGKIKGRARTVVGGAGLAQYRVHLHSEGTSLGLIPLLADDTCWFGAIDVDIQGEVKLNEPIEELEKRIRSLELPLVVCRSKSGGAHLYLFGSHPIAARVMQSKLSEFASLLGYGGCEIFPKQIMRVNEQDRGNWINIAMYGSLAPEGTERYAIRNGKPIRDLSNFIAYAESMRLSQKSLSDVSVKLSDVFADGPPCLQHLTTFGLEKGGRNTTLTNVAIYFKKKFPDDWQDHVMKFNFDCVKPSLDVGEVNQILKNISRKEYFYTCKQPPLCNHCDKKACVKREFGVTFGSSDAQLFPLDNLTRCVSKDSVRWYAEHQGFRVELTTDQLLSPIELQKVFIEKFAQLIMPGKKTDWHVRLRELMETCTDVHDPDDASVQGQFENLLDNFFSASRPARNRDELIKGNSYTEDKRIYFRSEDLFNYLNVRRFQHKPHEIWTWLKGMGAEATQMRIKGKLIRVWSMPEPERYDGSEISMPSALVTEL
jgi:hypothetical protein